MHQEEAEAAYEQQRQIQEQQMAQQRAYVEHQKAVAAYNWIRKQNIISDIKKILAKNPKNYTAEEIQFLNDYEDYTDDVREELAEKQRRKELAEARKQAEEARKQAEIVAREQRWNAGEQKFASAKQSAIKISAKNLASYGKQLEKAITRENYFPWQEDVFPAQNRATLVTEDIFHACSRAILETLENPTKTITKTYTPREHATKHAPINSGLFRNCTGTPAQHQISEEALSTINYSSTSYNDYVDYPFAINEVLHIKNIHEILVYYVGLVSDHNRVGNISQAYDYLDFCQSLNDLQIRIIDLFNKHASTGWKALGASWRFGINYEAEFGERFLAGAQAHQQSAKGINDSIERAALCLQKMLESSYSNKAVLDQKIITQAATVIRSLDSNARDSGEKVIEFVTNILLQSGTLSSSPSAANPAPLIDRLKANMRQESKIAFDTDAGKHSINTLLTPLRTIYSKALKKLFEEASARAQQKPANVQPQQPDVKQTNPKPAAKKQPMPPQQSGNQPTDQSQVPGQQDTRPHVVIGNVRTPIIFHHANIIQVNSINQTDYEANPRQNIVTGGTDMCGFFSAYNASRMLDATRGATTHNPLIQMGSPELFNEWLLSNGPLISTIRPGEWLNADTIQRFISQRNLNNVTIIEYVNIEAAFVRNDAGNYITDPQGDRIFLPAEHSIIEAINHFRITHEPHVVILNTGDHWISILLNGDQTIIADSLHGNGDQTNNPQVQKIARLFRTQAIRSIEEIDMLRDLNPNDLQNIFARL